jgi:hypothetical protein
LNEALHEAVGAARTAKGRALALWKTLFAQLAAHTLILEDRSYSATDDATLRAFCLELHAQLARTDLFDGFQIENLDQEDLKGWLDEDVNGQTGRDVLSAAIKKQLKECRKVEDAA